MQLKRRLDREGDTVFALGMGQMLVEAGAVTANLERAAEMIRGAADRCCRVVVLPECLDIGWGNPAALDLAQPIPGAHSEVLCQGAQESSIYVVAGVTEREGDRVFNAAILISPAGEILLKHRKINELACALGIYSTGDRLSIAETPLGTIAVNICADNFPDSLALGHSLGRMGAQLLVSPCAWAVDGDHDNEKEPYGEMWRNSYSTLASLYDMTVVGVSNVGWITAGEWKGRKCIGCSLAVGPEGNVLGAGPYGGSAETLIVVSVEMVPREVRGTEMAGMLKRKGYEGP